MSHRLTAFISPLTRTHGRWAAITPLALFCFTCPPAASPESAPDHSGSVELLLYEPGARPGPTDACEIEMCTSLLDLIRDAQDSIDFAVYGFRNQTAIAEALVAARERGVDVRGVVDRDVDGKNYYSSTDALVEALGHVRDDAVVDRALAKERAKRPGEGADRCARPAGHAGPLQCLAYDLGDRCLLAAQASRSPFAEEGAIMHDKFFVINRRYVWTGSTNISDSCAGGYNANLTVRVDSPVVAGWYQREFEQMYSGGRFHEKKGPSPPQRTRVGEDEVEVYFSPQDLAITRGVRPLLRAATRRIDIAVFFLTNKWITADLIAARLRGVEVRVILDATGASNDYSKHELLRAAGVPVKIERYGGKWHMKSAAIDGTTVVTGSMNWTSAGESSNDENTLILRSPRLAAQYHQFFDSVWRDLGSESLAGRPDPESPDSAPSCTDGIDNDHDSRVDSEDPGCNGAPPPLPSLPPHRIVDKGEHSTCEHD